MTTKQNNELIKETVLRANDLKADLFKEIVDKTAGAIFGAIAKTATTVVNYADAVISAVHGNTHATATSAGNAALSDLTGDLTGFF